MLLWNYQLISGSTASSRHSLIMCISLVPLDSCRYPLCLWIRFQCHFLNVHSGFGVLLIAETVNVSPMCGSVDVCSSASWKGAEQSNTYPTPSCVSLLVWALAGRDADEADNSEEQWVAEAYGRWDGVRCATNSLIFHFFMCWVHTCYLKVNIVFEKQIRNPYHL